MASAYYYVDYALRACGITPMENASSSADASFAFDALNNMLDMDSTNPYMVFNEAAEVFDFIPNQQIYTIGSGGDFDTIRPVSIDQAFYRQPNISGGGGYVDKPIVILDYIEYSNISTKGFSSALPQYLFYNAGAPLSTIQFWPVPSGTNVQFVLWSKKSLNGFANINSVLNFPPGYDEYIKTNLAVRLALLYKQEISSTMISWAQESKKLIESTNIVVPPIQNKLNRRRRIDYPISPAIYSGS